MARYKGRIYAHFEEIAPEIGGRKALRSERASRMVLRTGGHCHPFSRRERGGPEKHCVVVQHGVLSVTLLSTKRWN